MPKIRYEQLNMGQRLLDIIAKANEIVETYAAEGYDLTLRQLYYQFVARDLIANKQSEYKRLCDIIGKGRRAGLIDWSAIVDRTRNLQRLGTWESPQSIVDAVAAQFRYDIWADQQVYVEVWFEKDALMGVFERAAEALRVPFFSCRGYTSDSEVWSAAQRLKREARGGRDVVLLHFGDHDPSGLDMTRDIRARLRLFGAGMVDVRRLALSMEQIEQYEPPPNPAKESDSRFVSYCADTGCDESWELDALEPTVLAALVRGEVAELVDRNTWQASREREERAKAELAAISKQYPAVVKKFAAKVDVDVPDDFDDELDEREDEDDDDTEG